MRPGAQVIILLVEDDEVLNRAILRRFKEHARILVTDTSNQAWTLFQVYQDSISLILLDGMLRGSDSLKLLRMIRATGFKGTIVSTTSLPELKRNMLPVLYEGEPDQPSCDEHVAKTDLAEYISNFIAKFSV